MRYLTALVLLVLATLLPACTSVAGSPRRATARPSTSTASRFLEPSNVGTLPPLQEPEEVRGKIPFQILMPAETKERKLKGVRISGGANAPLDERGVDLEFDGGLSVIERPLHGSKQASEVVHGVLGGDFDPRYMVHTSVAGRPAIGWNPIDDRRPGGRTVPYAALVWTAPGDKAIYTVFGTDGMTLDDLKQVAESLSPQ